MLPRSTVSPFFRAPRRGAWIALIAMLWLSVAPLLSAASGGSAGAVLLGAQWGSPRAHVGVTDHAMAHADAHGAQTQDAADEAPAGRSAHHGSTHCPFCVLGSATPMPVDVRVFMALVPQAVATLVRTEIPLSFATHVGAPPPSRAPPQLP